MEVHRDSEHYPLQDGTPEAVPAEIAAKVASIELYELDADPGESDSRAGSNDSQPVLAEIAGILDAYLETESADPERGSRFTPDEGHIERLRSLGYVE